MNIPPLNLSVDQDRANAYAKAMITELTRVVSAMLPMVEEAESTFHVPPNYCEDSKSRVVVELFVAYRAIYRSYFCAVKTICSLIELRWWAPYGSD